MAGIVGHLTKIATSTDDITYTDLAEIIDFEAPASTLIEVNSTTLDSTIEEFSASTLLTATEFTFTAKFKPTVARLTKGTVKYWRITFPKYASGSAAAGFWKFQGFVKGFDAVAGSPGQTEAMRYKVTVRLTTAMTETLEA